MPTVLTGLLALLLSLLYMGGIVNPNWELHDLPIAVVNDDTGKPPPGQQENLGAQVTAAVAADTGEARPTGARSPAPRPRTSSIPGRSTAPWSSRPDSRTP